MSNEDNPPKELQSTQTDHLTVSAKAILGMVPVVGPMFSELIGAVIPKQRMDRLVQFVAACDRRLAKLEDDSARARWQDDSFLELVEEVVRQAARATSDQRREYLAAVLATEMSREQLEENDSRHLLRILGELNDIEIVWLRHYAGNSFKGHDEFQELHREITAQRVMSDYPSDEARIQVSALKESYLVHLVQLGLMEEILWTGIDRIPEVDLGGKKFRVRREITCLGHMLLELIGFESERKSRITEFKK